MTDSDMGARVREILDGGGGEIAEGQRFLPLVTLDSGARYGLDKDLAWILVSAEGVTVRYAPAQAHLFHEALEWKRARFDDAIEAGAKAHGLPPEGVLFSFPAVAVIRAVLAKQASYLTRLALQWIGPTELRELRAEIKDVIGQDNMPVPVRELAERLLVPE
jgi:hypothetical protein